MRIAETRSLFENGTPQKGRSLCAAAFSIHGNQACQGIGIGARSQLARTRFVPRWGQECILYMLARATREGVLVRCPPFSVNTRHTASSPA